MRKEQGTLPTDKRLPLQAKEKQRNAPHDRNFVFVALLDRTIT
jgi:hypothetical protein